jgi:hypothetical protein
MNPDRVPPPGLENLFLHARSNESDINEHLDLLRELASECEHVTELGLRAANASTVALLAAQPAQFVSWDINLHAVVSNQVAFLHSVRGRTKFQPRVGDTLEIILEPTDMLFIDTLHTAAQLVAELKRHADPVEAKVTRYLVFHDTKTFGDVGEDGSTPGLREAIRWFQRNHAFPLWQLVHDRQNNNGLVVLKHVGAL